MWSSDNWEKQRSKFLQLPTGRAPTAQSDTRVQFHQDQVHFLVVHETQLAIFETKQLECVKQVRHRHLLCIRPLIVSTMPCTNVPFSCWTFISVSSGFLVSLLLRFPMQRFLVIVN